MSADSNAYPHAAMGTAVSHRVGRPRPAVRLVELSTEALSAPGSRSFAELEALRRVARRRRAALRTAWVLFAAAVLAFYLVPTGAALSWW